MYAELDPYIMPTTVQGAQQGRYKQAARSTPARLLQPLLRRALRACAYGA
jgi:hypothetical protein